MKEKTRTYRECVLVKNGVERKGCWIPTEIAHRAATFRVKIDGVWDDGWDVKEVHAAYATDCEDGIYEQQLERSLVAPVIDGELCRRCGRAKGEKKAIDPETMELVPVCSGCYKRLVRLAEEYGIKDPHGWAIEDKSE